MTNMFRKVCPRDPSHDISAAGVAGQFCPICGSKLIEVPIDDPLPKRDDRTVRRGSAGFRLPTRMTLSLAIGAGLLAAGVGVFLMWPAKPSPQRIVVANVPADHGCRLQNVVVTFWKEGRATLEGQASAADGVTLIDYRMAQGPAPARRMTVNISAVLSSGFDEPVGVVTFNRQPSAVTTKSFHYFPAIFDNIVDAKVVIQCSM